MRRLIERARTEEGFTLIELLIVIVILGILAGVVVFSVGGITDRGTTAACKTDLSTIQVGVEAYYAKLGSYPADLDPTLTNSDGNNAGTQFLRADPSIAGVTKTGTGYAVTYDPATGGVTANNC